MSGAGDIGRGGRSDAAAGDREDTNRIPNVPVSSGAKAAGEGRHGADLRRLEGETGQIGHPARAQLATRAPVGLWKEEEGAGVSL